MELAARSGMRDRPTGPYGILLWAIAGFALYLLIGVASTFATLVFEPVLAVAGLRIEAGELGLSVRNALHPLVWGVLVAAVSVPMGRRLVRDIRFTRDGWVVLLAGLLLAAATWLLLEEFVRGRMAYFDPEYVGFAIFTWPALVAIALSGWAALAVPRGSSAPLIAALVLASTGLAVALLPSIPGVTDGMAPKNLPLAAVFLVDIAYAVAAILVAFRRAGAPSPS
jgi:hypothetical protein